MGVYSQEAELGLVDGKLMREHMRVIMEVLATMTQLAFYCGQVNMIRHHLGGGRTLVETEGSGSGYTDLSGFLLKMNFTRECTCGQGRS